MPLLPPRVMGPISECNRGAGAVWVQGQLTGATVEILVDGVAGPVGGGIAAWSSQVFDLNAGVALAPGARVRARQKLGAEVSSASPDQSSVLVQKRPPAMGGVDWVSHLYRCGRCLQLGGLVPGASVEVRIVGGPSLATSTSPNGGARLHLSAAIGPGQTLEAIQTACGQTGPRDQGPPPDAVPHDPAHPRELPPPVIRKPVRECDRAVLVGNVLEGATVTLGRSGPPPAGMAPPLHACFDSTESWLLVDRPFRHLGGVGETISVRQDFAACELHSLDSPPTSVSSAAPMPAPIIAGTLCAGGTAVRIANLRPGARVTILQTLGSAVTALGTGEAPDTTCPGAPPPGSPPLPPACFDFAVPPLVGGAQITAIQEQCGVVSGPSNAVTVRQDTAALPTPVVPGPLFECGATVRVTNIHPPSYVRVMSAILGEIGARWVFYKTNDDTAEVDVPVAPLLLHADQHDEIWAVAEGCGQTAVSARKPVGALPDVLPPVIEAVNECTVDVPVRDVVPGARVFVYVNGVFRGSQAVGGRRGTVRITGRLRVGNVLTARQRICGRQSELGPQAVVTRAPGRWIVLKDFAGADLDAGVAAIHAALLAPNHILYFGGDQFDPGRNDLGAVDATRLFDCGAFTIAYVGSPVSDVFCCGHAHLQDGSLLVAGGTQDYPDEFHPHLGIEHFRGHRRSWIFNHGTATWTETGLLVPEPGREPRGGGRWYPTLLTLLDGRVLALSGHPVHDDSRHQNRTLELYTSPSPAPTSGAWKMVPPGSNPEIELDYPRLHVMRDGGVFSTTPMAGRVKRWTPYNDALAWSDMAAAPPTGLGHLDWTSVLLPLLPDDYRGRVLLAGDREPHRIDLDAGPPVWEKTKPRALAGSPPRINLNATLLPTGEVFVCGGVRDVDDDDTAVLDAELYRPTDDTWEQQPRAKVPRNYHSVALLMPDGRVWTGGSSKDHQVGMENQERRIEIFEPWYHCAARPVIALAPDSVACDEAFVLRTPQAGAISRIVVILPGSVTHAFNAGQRYIGLAFRPFGGNRLLVTAPPNRVTPPGDYLLYVLWRDPVDGREVPSIGHFMRIGPATQFITPLPRIRSLFRQLVGLAQRVMGLPRPSRPS